MTGPAPGLRWLGHSTVVLDVAGVRLVTDPVLRDRVGVLRRHAAPIAPVHYAGTDAVLLSHLHRDHVDLPSLRRLQPSLVVAPRGAATLLRSAGLRHVTELDVGARTSIGGVEVEAVRAVHDGRRQALPASPAGPALGYVVHAAPVVYVAGDTALFPQMRALRECVDVAVLPVGGWGLTLGAGHMDPVQAAAALALISPRVAVPMHWGTLRPIGLRRCREDLFSLPGERFRAAAAVAAPEVAVVVLAPGDAVDPQVLRPAS